MKSEYGKGGNNGADGMLLVVIRPFFRLSRYFLLFHTPPPSSRWAGLNPLRSHSRYCLPLMVSALCLFGSCNRYGADRMVANVNRNNAPQQPNEQIGRGPMNRPDLQHTIRATRHDDRFRNDPDLHEAGTDA